MVDEAGDSPACAPVDRVDRLVVVVVVVVGSDGGFGEAGAELVFAAGGIVVAGRQHELVEIEEIRQALLITCERGVSARL